MRFGTSHFVDGNRVSEEHATSFFRI